MTSNVLEITCRSVDVDDLNVPLTSDWLSSHTTPMDGEEETGAHPHQAAALGQYLHGHANVNDTVAALITAPPNSSDSEVDTRDRVFGIIEDALFELPQNYTPALVKLLRKLDAVPGANGTSNPVWKGLKSFGDSWSDSWKQQHWRKALETRDPQTRDKRREAHVHRAFVEATCATAATGISSECPGEAEDGILPLSWGYECLSDALECEEGVVWDFEIPASAIWIRIAGKRIVEGARRKETSWALERGGRLWPPGPMSMERWQFWLTRLNEVKNIGGEVSQAAENALACAGEMSK